MSHTTKVCAVMSIIWEIFITVYQALPEGGGCWLHVLLCPILCHNLQLWRTLNTTNDTPASLLSEDWESNILQFHHVASSFSKTLDFQFWPTMTPYSWQITNYLMLPHLQIVLLYSPIQTAEKCTQKYKEAESYNKGQSCEHNNLQLHSQCSRVM